MSDLYHNQSIHMHRKQGAVALMSVEYIGGGVGIIDCIECGGDGDWSKFHPEPETLMDYERDCVQCKGTGKRQISFWPNRHSSGN